MAPFLEQAGNVYRCTAVSEDPRQQFLAANSAGWGTSAPTRPERQENEAGTTVDSQLEAWTTRVPRKVDWAARRQPCAGKEH